VEYHWGKEVEILQIPQQSIFPEEFLLFLKKILRHLVHEMWTVPNSRGTHLCLWVIISMPFNFISFASRVGEQSIYNKHYYSLD
jgi:hypothetical protein